MRRHPPESNNTTDFEDIGDWNEPLDGGPTSSFSDAELIANIGKGLRAVYMDVLRQPLPDKFVALLRKIDDPNGQGQAAARLESVDEMVFRTDVEDPSA